MRCKTNRLKQDIALLKRANVTDNVVVELLRQRAPKEFIEKLIREVDTKVI